MLQHACNASRRLATRAVLAAACIVVSACSTTSPTTLSVAELKSKTLLKSEMRTVSGVRFLDCHYGRGGPPAAKVALQFLGAGRARSNQGEYIVSFWADPAPARGSPQRGTLPGDGRQFYPVVIATCPRAMDRTRLIAEDLMPAPARQAQTAPPSAGLVDVDRLGASAIELRREVVAGTLSLSVGLRDWIDRHGRSIRGQILLDERADSERASILAGGTSNYPAAWALASSEALIRVLDDLADHGRRSYPRDPPDPVALELQRLAVLRADLAAAMPGLRTLVSLQKERAERTARVAAAEARQRRRARACAGLSAARAGAEPSELDMCLAFARSVHSNTDGYERSLNALGGLLGQWLGDLTRHYGGSLDAEIVGFRKAGVCTAETGEGGREGFVCPQEGDLKFLDNHLLQGLQSAGIPGLASRGFYWREGSGDWQFGMTKNQAEAQRRTIRAQSEQSEKKRAEVEECRNRYLMTPLYWRCG